MLDRLQQGDVPRKHHVALRGPGGELRHEECITRDGFDGAYSIVYHSRRPHTARQVDGPHLVAPEASAPRALRRRHYLGGQVQASGTTARTAATATISTSSTRAAARSARSSGICHFKWATTSACRAA